MPNTQAPIKILVAEDEAVARKILEKRISEWGYDVIAVKDGEVALKEMQKKSAPKLAVLDWMMPKMDGIDVCREIRKIETPPPPYLILLTAKIRKEEIIEGLEAGADEYLTKPYDDRELKARLEIGKRITTLQDELQKHSVSISERADDLEKDRIGLLYLMEDMHTTKQELSIHKDHLEELVDVRTDELDKQKTFSENVLQSTPTALITFSQGKVKTINRSFMDIFGIHDNWYQQSIDDILSKIKLDSKIRKKIKSGILFDDVETMCKPYPNSDDIMHLEMSLTRLRSKAMFRINDSLEKSLIGKRFEDEEYFTETLITGSANALQNTYNKSPKEFFNILDNAPISVIMVNDENEITYSNKKVEDVFGYNQGELKGKSHDLLVPEQHRDSHRKGIKKFFSKPIFKPMGLGASFPSRHKDGTKFHSEIGLAIIKIEDTPQAISVLRVPEKDPDWNEVKKTELGKLFIDEKELIVKSFLKTGNPIGIKNPVTDLALHFKDNVSIHHSVSLNIFPIFKNGVLNSLFIGMNDISEFTLFREEIQEDISPKAIREAMEKIRYHKAAVFNLDHELIAANKLYLRKYPVSENDENLLGDKGKPVHCYEISHASDVPCWDLKGEHPCPIRDVEYKKPTFGVHIHHDSGEPRTTNLNYFPIYNTRGEIIYFLETMVDVSEQRDIESILDSGKELTDSSLDNYPDIYFILDGKGKIKSMNERAEILISTPKEKLINTLFGKLFEEDEEDEEDEEEVLLAIDDISERIKMEEEAREKDAQLVHSGRLTALGEIATGTAHELNQPLAVIRAELQGLQWAQEFDEKLNMDDLNSSIDIVIRQVDRAAKIIDNMRSFARTGSEELEEINLNIPIDLALNFYRGRMKEHNITLIEEIEDELPHVLADNQKVEQIIVNFLSNAQFAVESKKAQSEHDVEMKIILRLKKHINGVSLEIIDNGVGMSDKTLEKFMDPFFTTKPVGQGTGLGMTIVNKIIKEFEADFKVESEEGVGTKMQVIFKADV